jgi:branched-chain amino acid transport system ATP-binding protein
MNGARVDPILQAEGVHAWYGSSHVLHGVDLAIGRGETVGLLGRNGMGKSTLIRTLLGHVVQREGRITLFGLVPLRSGEIRFAGERLNGRPTDAIARLGIALVPEGRHIFPNLTVRENLDAFAENRSGSRAPWTAARVLELFPRLAERRGAMGNQLSGGEQQMLAIGRALMTNPRLLILDEATEGLAPRVREDIWRCLAALKDNGHTILVIDKYVDRLVKLADQHTILERGRVVWHGNSPTLAADTSLWHRYLGV